MKHIFSLNNFLNETYKSNKELNMLTTELIKIISEQTINMVKPQFADKFYNLIGVDNIFSLTNKIKYTEIFNFLDSYNLYINPSINNDIKTIKAAYKSYNPNNGEIILYIRKEFIDEIKNSDILLNSDSNMLSFKMYYELHKNLLHELTHAFDDFRSKGRYSKDKKSIEFYNKREEMNKIKRKENKEESEMLKIHKDFKKYLNLRHEIDARIAETLHILSFWDVDFVDIDDNTWYNEYTMRDFSEIKNEFISEMRGYNELSNKNKKRVLHMLGKFYILAEEEAKELNKEKKINSMDDFD